MSRVDRAVDGIGTGGRWASRRRVRGFAVAATAFATLIVGACSSGGSSTEAGTEAPAPDAQTTSEAAAGGDTSAAAPDDSAAAPAGDDGGVAEAQAIVAEAMKAAAGWQGPDSAPAPQEGARVAIISANQGAEGTAIIADHLTRAGEALGWKTTILDGQGDPSAQIKALNAAVDGKYDGIVLDILDTRVLQEGIQRVLEAKIPIISLGQLKNEPESIPDVSHDWIRAGQLAANYMIANSPDGAANVLILADFEFPAVKDGEYVGITSVLNDKTKCPNCKVTEKQFLSKNLTTDPGQLTIAQLQEDPTTNWVWCFDACMQQVATQVEASGIKTDAHGVGMNGLPANLDLIENGSFQIASIGNPYPFESWATMDNLNRIMNGEPVYDWAAALPLRIIDQSNVGSLSPEDRKIGWIGDVDYETEFKKLWGAS